MKSGLLLGCLFASASSLCLPLAEASANPFNDVTRSVDVPLSGLLSAQTASIELVSVANLHGANTSERFGRYDLFGVNGAPAEAIAQGVAVVPGLLQTANGALIIDIDAFVATCPDDDPATKEILSDIQLSVNGVPLASEPCVAPVPLDVRPSPLLYYLQMLRVAYYMDQTQSGLYPWTPGSYWSWIKTRIGGIDIDDSSSPSNYCCIDVPGRLPAAHLAGPWTLAPYQLVYDVLAGLVLLLSHEVRHTDEIGHVVCESGHKAGLPACDHDFDPENLSAFGVAWWMANLIETGQINVGLSCTPVNAQIAANFLHSLDVLGTEFMGIKPPPPVASPLPGGTCPASD